MQHSIVFLHFPLNVSQITSPSFCDDDYILLKQPQAYETKPFFFTSDAFSLGSWGGLVTVSRLIGYQPFHAWNCCSFIGLY